MPKNLQKYLTQKDLTQIIKLSKQMNISKNYWWKKDKIKNKKLLIIDYISHSI